MVGQGQKGIKRKRGPEIPEHRKFISGGDIRRLARRGGVRRIANDSYDISKKIIHQFLKTLIRDSIVFAQYAKRSTILAIDAVYALKRKGLRWLG